MGTNRVDVFPVCTAFSRKFNASDADVREIPLNYGAIPLRRSAIERCHSLPQCLMLAAAMVDLTGTNYQCQMIILKKRQMLASDQTQIKADSLL